MISPCGGCDVTVIAAVVCYLSFFLSGCSFFLYWYWLGNYRDEINPLKGRYPSDTEASDCDVLEPEPIDQDESYNSNNYGYDFSAETPTTSTQVPEYHQEIANISRCVQHSETDHDLSTLPLYEGSTSASIESNLGIGAGIGESDSFIINTITLPSSSSCLGLAGGQDFDSLSIHPQPDDPGGGDPADREADNESTSPGEEDGAESGKAAVSDNPYLNGDTYSQNLLWGLHGIFTNLVEAILAAVFYSGLFENNLKTTLVWVIGFSTNFIIGNLLYVLLLLYCTNRAKARQLWGRWVVESTFNVVKDLYYIWVGVSFLNNLVRSINSDVSDPP